MATASVKNLNTGGTSGVLYTERRDFYLDPKNYDPLFQNEAPFTWLARKNRQSGLKDPIFKMFQYEYKYMRRKMVVNGSTVTIEAGSTGAATESDAITFDGIVGMGTSIDTSYIHKVFEVWDSTNSNYKGTVLLTDDTSSTTAKFKNMTATAITTADDDIFYNVTNAMEDGSEAPDAWSSELDYVYNSTQQIKNSCQLEGDIYYAALRGDTNELIRLRAEAFKEHTMDIEGALLKGSSLLGTNLSGSDTFTDLDKLTGDTSKVVRSTMGLITALRKYGSASTTDDYRNKWDIASAAFKYEDYVDMTEKMFQYNPTDMSLYAICGTSAMSYWSKLLYARSSKDNWVVQLSPTQTDKFGFTIRALETPHGMLKLMKSDALRTPYNNTMVVVDDRHIKYMEYRPTKFMANVKTDNAYDGEKDQYFSQVGLGLTHLKSHALVNIV